jgi:hypothetical protein
MTWFELTAVNAPTFKAAVKGGRFLERRTLLKEVKITGMNPVLTSS